MGTINRLAIVGPGLIGTSVALAARRRWPDVEIRTIDRSDPIADAADCRVVILAAPIEAIIETLPRLSAVADPRALVIDTGSTKRAIMSAALACGLRHFVGGHPMAGGTTPGPADARSDLFDGRPWFVMNAAAPEAVTRGVAFVEALGARAVVLPDNGETHDRLVAALSHVPQIVSSALMTTVARAAGASHLPLAGGGLRDTTRLASSRADMWQSVLATNSSEIKPLLHDLAADLLRHRRPSR